MPTPRERLDALRGRKRLQELRAIRDQQTADPRIALQDLIIEQSKAPTEARQQQITALRGKLGTPDTDRSVSGFEQVQTEQPSGSIGSFGRGVKQGILNVGSGALGAGAQALDVAGVDTAQFQQDLEASRGIDLQRTKQITKEAPISGFVGELVGEVAALPFPAARTIKGATALGAGTGALVAEGTDRDPLTGAAIGGVLGGVLSKAEKLLRSKSAAKDEIADLLKAGSADISTATSKLNPSGKVVTDKTAKEAIRQGADEALVAAIKPATTKTKRIMAKMLRVSRDVKRDITSEAVPTDVIGNSLMKRVRHARVANIRQGKELDKVAKGLTGKINVQPALKSFADDLKALDIGIGRRAINFKGSAIEGLDAPQKIINLVIRRAKTTDLTNPKAAHKFKRFLDEQLKSGKSQKEGLTGQTINIVETLRKNIDDTLDSAFPDYNRVNTAWSKSKKALDGFQDIIGKKIDIFESVADVKIGTILNRTLSNAPGRAGIKQSIKDIDKVVKATGGDVSDDILLQVNFADQMEKLFKTSPGRSLQGQVERAIPTTLSQVGLEVGKSAVSKVRGVNEDAAFEAIMKLLREQANGQ